MIAYWLPVFVWVGLITYFSSVPRPYGPLTGTTTTDLLGHALGFLGLMLLVMRWFGALAGTLGARPLFWAFVACLAYGMLDELHQIPIPGRSFEWVDFAADSIGTTAAAVIALGWRRLTRPSPG